MNLIYCGSPAAVLFRIGAASCCGGTYESVNRQLYHSLRSFQTSARRKVISVYRNLDQATSSEEDPLGAEDNGSHAHRMALQQRSQQVSSMEESLKSPWVQRLFNGMLNQNRGMLAQAITLAESTHPRNKVESQALLSMVLAHAKDEYEKAGASALSFRIGSLLGDKTRMHELSRDPNAYIRPSPSGGKLGGVARNTQDAIYLCECAGYKIIFIETVGVGQSELAVADMVDAFVLLIPPGGGDELQGIKKGIIERSHFICITKADGDLIPAARRIQYDYLSAIKYMRPVSQNWKTKVMRISAFTGEGLKELWGDLEKYHQMMVSCGEFFSNRKDQRKSWMWNYIADNIVSIFKQHPAVKKKLNEMERQVIEGISTPGIAAEVLLKEFIKEVP